MAKSFAAWLEKLSFAKIENIEKTRHSIMIQIVQSACIINAAAAAAANRRRPLKTIVDSSNFDDHK